MKLTKKGFTLVESIVVLVVTLIVVAMVCEFVLVFRRQSTMVEENYTGIADVTDCKNIINDFIKANDNEKQIKINNGLTAGTDSLTFANKKMTWTKDGTEYRSESFDSLEVCRFVSQNDMLFCTVYCDGKEVKLVFNIFSNTQRDRYSTADRANG